MVEFQAIEGNTQALTNIDGPNQGVVIGRSWDREGYLQVSWVIGPGNTAIDRVTLWQEGNNIKGRVTRWDIADHPTIEYDAFASVNYWHIVSTNTHTAVIANYLEGNRKQFDLHFWEPGRIIDLSHRLFPKMDAATYIPRIAAYLNARTSIVGFVDVYKPPNSESIRKVDNRYGGDDIELGTGLCLHTGMIDREPVPVLLENDAEGTAEYYWNLLPADRRLAVAVKYIPRFSGGVQYAVYDKVNEALRTASLYNFYKETIAEIGVTPSDLNIFYLKGGHQFIGLPAIGSSGRLTDVGDSVIWVTLNEGHETETTVGVFAPEVCGDELVIRERRRLSPLRIRDENEALFKRLPRKIRTDQLIIPPPFTKSEKG